MYEELLEELDACKTFSDQARIALRKSDLKNDTELKHLIEQIENYSEMAYDWVKDEALG